MVGLSTASDPIGRGTTEAQAGELSVRFCLARRLALDAAELDRGGGAQ